MSPPTKRRRVSSVSDQESVHSKSHGAGSDLESGSFQGGDDEGDSPDTDDEIEHLKRQKSKKTAKRKIRATGAATFGATLQTLIDTDAPSSLPLALKPSIAKKRKGEQLEKKAKRVLHVERREKEDKNRIRDIIGGWGGESERALRKVAQRGVVKLFNAIQQAQSNAVVAEEEKKASRGSGKPTLAAPDIKWKEKQKKKGKNKDNVLGRGQESGVDKDQFFELLRCGGMVSKG
ncbi:Rrp15p domain containing protein [Amanita muscaria]